MKTYQMILAIWAAVVISVPVGAYAQSHLFGDGQSGAGLAANLESGEDYTMVGATFGYTVNGRIDFGLSFGRASFDESEYGEDFSATQIAPYANATIVRPTAQSPVGVILQGAYGKTSFSGDVLDNQQWDLSSVGLSAGGVLYLELEASPEVKVYPALGVGYSSVTSTIEDQANNSVDEEVTDTLFSGGVTLLFNNRVFVTPSFTSFDGSSSWGVSAGVVLSSK